MNENQKAHTEKLAFRDEGVFVVCYISSLDGTEREELGRLSGVTVHLDPALFDTWKEAMKTIGFRTMELVSGVQILGGRDLPPEMLEGKDNGRG